MPENAKQQEEKSESSFKVISLDLIDDPAKPMRSDLSPESVEDLVISISQLGIIEPLVVREKSGRYEVIAGHRRLIAAGLAKLAVAPCYVLKVDDQNAEFIKIHENMYRAEIHPSDQAEHFDYLIQHHKLSPAKIAQLINKSPAYVNDRLNIFNYPEVLREALNNGDIKFSVAREFYRIKDENKVAEYLSYAIKTGVTPAVAKQWTDDFLRQSQPLPQSSAGGQAPPPSDDQYVTSSTCVYCTKPVELSRAVICHMHQECYSEVAKN